MKLSIQKIKENNSTVEIKPTKELVKITKPWNDISVNLDIPKTKIKELEQIIFPEELVAIYDKKLSQIEFIYGPVDKDDKVHIRAFDFLFEGETFKCSFENLSSSLELIAKSFIEGSSESKSNFRNLRFLRDIYTRPEMFKDILKDVDLISFFVRGNISKIEGNLVYFSKCLNFYMNYFDRGTPYIQIIGKDVDNDKFKRPCYYELFDNFPSKINSRKIETTLLDIFQVARSTDDIRLSFIFYFQILEYCSYYYLNNKIQAKISQVLKNPLVADKANDLSKSLIEELKDHFSQKDDSLKLEQTIVDFCSIEDIKVEIESNADYFSKDLEFEGGLKINKIIKDKDSITKMVQDDLILVKKNIEKIRNVLVHLRESRENKVILPTEENDNLLLPYLFLVRRIAEKVTIQFS